MVLALGIKITLVSNSRPFRVHAHANFIVLKFSLENVAISIFNNPALSVASGVPRKLADEGILTLAIDHRAFCAITVLKLAVKEVLIAFEDALAVPLAVLPSALINVVTICVEHLALALRLKIGIELALVRTKLVFHLSNLNQVVLPQRLNHSDDALLFDCVNASPRSLAFDKVASVLAFCVGVLC